jgi:hypothetical protein
MRMRKGWGMIDLDKMIKRVNHGGHCHQDIFDLIEELRAAREVVAYFREWNGHSDECDRTPCDCGYVTDLEVLKKYDEARRG